MNEGGRPTVMTEAVLQKMEDAFMYGYSDREACLYAGIALQTLYNYGEANPGYLERKETLKLSPRLHAKRTIVEALQKKDKSMATWYAVHRMGDEFAPKNKLEHSGSVETTTSPEQAHSAAADALRERYEVELRATIVRPSNKAPEGKQAGTAPLAVGLAVAPLEHIMSSTGALTL